MKRLHVFLIAIFITLPLTILADDVSFTASAPSTVILNEPFQLTYTVNASGSKDLRAPEMADFDILAGPFTSRSSSVSIVNGKRSATVTVTYTYTLMAKKEGTFTIPSAGISIGKDKYTSNGLKVKVLPPDEKSNQSQNNAGQQQASARSSSGSNISSDDVFIRTQVSKTNVYEQECILLTYKLYTLVDVTQFTNNTKLPDYSGFLKQEIEQSSNKQLSYEHYNGHNYGTVILMQELLYPQHTGTIEIDKATFEAVIRVQNRSQVRSIFDDFFDSYTNVTKMLVAPGVKINVNALPAGKPSSYTGGVGRFNINSSISTNKLKTNEAVTIKLTISGTGNMKLLKTPAVDFPEGFEPYDPKIENNFKNTTSGVSGSKTIEYLAIARSTGTYTVPPVEFAYFDTQDKTYKTLRTPEYQIVVEKGEGDADGTAVVGTYISKEDVKLISTDIRYINTDKLVLDKADNIEFGSLNFWLAYLIPFITSILLFIFFRKQIKEKADIAKVNLKKANKVAQQRLKQAQKYWKEGKKNEFYDEILRALWTYLSYKLSMPMANLNKENVANELKQHGVAQEQVDVFLNILNTCEYARYAPINSDDPMGDLYNQVAKEISNLEESIKR